MMTAVLQVPFQGYSKNVQQRIDSNVTISLTTLKSGHIVGGDEVMNGSIRYLHN